MQMKIDLSYDSSVPSSDTSFKSAIAAAATYLDTIITNSITVNIDVGLNEIDGKTLSSGVLAEGGPSTGVVLNYTQVKAALKAARDSTATDTAYANLPAKDPSGGGGFFVSTSQEKAWGDLAANGTGTDGYVGFSSSFSYYYGTTAPVPSNEYDLVSIAEHELTHALGRISTLGQGHLSVLDLFRYTAAGVQPTSTSQSAYFSIDGGRTGSYYFDTSSDPADWSSSTAPDSFDAYLGAGQLNPVSATDVTLLNVIGFAVNCFATGTRIATPDGETEVQRLRPGDLVSLADGGTAPVRWLGRQRLPAAFADRLGARPIRIGAGALAPGVPARDLLLSPGHALRLGELLVEARALCNGRTIREAAVLPPVITYWHVELDTHAVILAEGAAVESFLDGAAEFAFDNVADRPPTAGAAEELPYPRCRSVRQVPASLGAMLDRRAIVLRLEQAAA